jgi:hypothetical protein
MIVKKLFYIAFFLPLMATKCPQETVNIQVKNSTDNPIVFGVEKHSLFLAKTTSINEIGYISNDSSYINSKKNEKLNLKNIIKDSINYSGLLNVIKSKKTSKLNFPSETFLSRFLSKNEKQLVFYFYRIRNEQIVDNIFDSIILKKNKIKIGEDEINVFEYRDDKIIFKNN